MLDLPVHWYYQEHQILENLNSIFWITIWISSRVSKHERERESILLNEVKIIKSGKPKMKPMGRLHASSSQTQTLNL
jgi:hypothetical protein